ncbi:hypothetical protein J2W46_006293 [Paraburkholderia strydomiana]|nr:hypothetical protein [Paraburkholderia strydomiana]
MSLQRWITLWRRGRTVIRSGLLGSFLTCLAGTLFNAFVDGHFEVLGTAGLMRRLAIGYAGSAVVVVLAFPLLSGRPRRRSPDGGA